MDYVAADLHLGHENIIEYCDRPFRTDRGEPDVDQMNEALIENWNAVVDEGDDALFLGDFSHERIPAEYTEQWRSELNGDITFVYGNHDDNLLVPLLDDYHFSSNGRTFYCTHIPDDIPDNIGRTVLHGHEHNNDVDTHPFYDPERGYFNVSVELTNYEPVPVEELHTAIEKGERLPYRPA